jgi:3-oxoacyl-[acyl-carrier protein] reductase
LRNVLVTGGSRGIGLAVTRKLANEGYRAIALARRTSEPLDAAILEQQTAERGHIGFVAFDLCRTEAIPGLVRQLKAEFGSLYGLVNNAAIGTDGLLANMPVSQIEALIKTNTLSPIVLSKYVIRSMIAAGEGRIVNVASIVAFTGGSGLSVYGATKASMIGFTKSLAREVGRVGVTVNAVAPGFIDTELTKTLSEDQREQIARRSALRRLARTEDVADMVAFLMGSAGRNITGTVMTVDAGASA